MAVKPPTLFTKACTRIMLEHFFIDNEKVVLVSRATGALIGVADGFVVGDGGPYFTLEDGPICPGITLTKEGKWYDALHTPRKDVMVYDQKAMVINQRFPPEKSVYQVPKKSRKGRRSGYSCYLVGVRYVGID